MLEREALNELSGSYVYSTISLSSRKHYRARSSKHKKTL